MACAAKRCTSNTFAKVVPFSLVSHALAIRSPPKQDWDEINTREGFFDVPLLGKD